jgi:hypothetical protein
MNADRNIDRTLRTYLVKMAKKLARSRGRSLATVSRYYHGGDQFLDDLDNGRRTITLRKLQEMLDRFAADWPADMAYPPPPHLVVPKPLSTNSRKKRRAKRKESAKGNLS